MLTRIINCKRCNKEFESIYRGKRDGWTLFCSHDCASRRIDMVGSTDGLITVIKRLPNKLYNYEDSRSVTVAMYECQCSCGTVFKSRAQRLINKRVKSCGSEECKKKLDKQKFQKYIGIARAGFTITEYIGRDKFGEAQFLFLCQCGRNDGVISLNSILRHKRNPCSCARSGSACHLTRKPAHNRALPGITPLKRLYDSYRRRAEHKKIEFSLTMEYFKEFIFQDCYYCGAKPTQIYPSAGRRKIGEKINIYVDTILYNGIDRMDPNVGYVMNNCVTCCGRCNEAKMDKTVDEFLQMIKDIYNKHIKTTLS